MQDDRLPSGDATHVADKVASEDAPPAYKNLIPHEGLDEECFVQAATLKCILIALSREQKLPFARGAAEPPEIDIYSVENETRRMRNFMLLTLAVDYECNMGVILTREDREYFTAIGKWIITLYRANEQSTLSRKDINKAGTPLLRLVYAPCWHLCIPIDIVVTATMRYMRSVERHKEYRSCTESVLREDGINRAVEKIWFDRKTLVPALVHDSAVRESLERKGRESGARCFLRAGPPLRPAEVCDTKFGLDEGPRVPFTLSQRGKEYEARREEREKRLGRLGWLSWSCEPFLK